MDLPATKPGYQLCSSSFIVKFIGAWKIWGREVENYNWHYMMVHLVKAFEMWPWDMARIEREAVEFNLWIGMVQITDRFSPIKRVVVNFPPKRLVLIYEVKRKQEMKKLRTLAAETISDLVSKKKDFETLEVPNELLTDMNEAYDDIIWRGNMKC